jgi:GT2 family glycosyltransferase
MVIEGEPPIETIRTLQSLQHQSSQEWALVVVVHDPWRTTFTSQLAVSGLQHSNKRLRLESVDAVVDVRGMFNRGLAACGDSHVSPIFPGDVWACDAVTLLSNRLSPGAVVYADEDCVTENGSYEAPLLKPSYSPEFLLRYSYIGRPLALGHEVVRAIKASELGMYAEIEHDLALRACELARTVEHIPEVLCHRSIPPPGTIPELEHVAAALKRRNELAEVSRGSAFDTFRITRTSPPDVHASIIIPFRDEPRFLRACVESIETTAKVGSFELILVDNGSLQPETATLLEDLATRANIQILTDDRPFNWAQLNNRAAQQAKGNLLVFLNNDIEALREGWLEVISSQAIRPGVGAVGARLLYPDGRLQHCGVVIGLGGAAGHLFVGLHEERQGYLRMARTTRECAAVTGACLATSRAAFTELNGFDESLGVDLNDIDYCLRAQRIGLSVLFEADAELIHRESPSRGTAGGVEDIVHFVDRWKESILQGDPFLNPHLTRVDSSCALRGPDETTWWLRWNEGLARS